MHTHHGRKAFLELLMLGLAGPSADDDRQVWKAACNSPAQMAHRQEMRRGHDGCARKFRASGPKRRWGCTRKFGGERNRALYAISLQGLPQHFRGQCVCQPRAGGQSTLEGSGSASDTMQGRCQGPAIQGHPQLGQAGPPSVIGRPGGAARIMLWRGPDDCACRRPYGPNPSPRPFSRQALGTKAHAAMPGTSGRISPALLPLHENPRKASFKPRSRWGPQGHVHDPDRHAKVG